MIKTAIFDIDDTLYDFGTAERIGRAAIRDYAESVIGVDGESFMTSFVEMLRLQMRLHGDSAGSHSRAIRCQLICEKMGLPIRHAPILNDLYWNTYIASIHPFPGIPEIFEKIREKGLKIGICTNMTADWQMKKLIQLGLIDQCDFIVSSEEANAEKPSRAIFDLCLEKAECQASECLFIGDNPVCDIQGALDAGMNALWLAQNPDKRAKYPDLPFVKSVTELSARIQQHI